MNMEVTVIKPGNKLEDPVLFAECDECECMFSVKFEGLTKVKTQVFFREISGVSRGVIACPNCGSSCNGSSTPKKSITEYIENEKLSKSFALRDL